jgi:capsular exopolysaccharide synthesis family protein
VKRDFTPETEGGGQPRRSPSGGKLDRLLAAREPGTGQGTQLAGLTAREFGRAPDAPGAWNRFLLAHLRWILVITVLVVAAAAAYAHSQTPQYHSHATVDVYFSSPDPAALQGPNMVTEKEIVASTAVLGIASRTLGVPVADLSDGLSLNVPAGSSVMNVGYADPVPWVARERAQIIAESYVTYRTPKPAAPPRRHAPAPATPTTTVTTLHATLITPADLPASPSSPNYLIDILAALVVGLALAIGTAAIRDHLDDRLRGPSDIQARSGAPVLSLIPAYQPLSRDPASHLTIVWSASSVVAEAYRGLRTRVIAAGAARGARTLLVTSAGWERKSMIAANLAVALAQSGRRTVLVCADLRWGTAHRLLGVPNETGLTTLLDRGTDLASELRAPGIHGLRVLPPGPLPDDPAEFLQRPDLRTVLGELRSRSDFVIIDAPPLLATSDTVPLARLTEMILLVSDARKSTRGHLDAAMHEAGEVAGKVIGSVLYNVGHRRWLRRGPAPRPATGQPDRYSQPGPFPGVLDGHAATELHPANNVSVTADPS